VHRFAVADRCAFSGRTKNTELAMAPLLVLIGWLMAGFAVAWFIGNASDLGDPEKRARPIWRRRISPSHW